MGLSVHDLMFYLWPGVKVGWLARGCRELPLALQSLLAGALGAHYRASHFAWMLETELRS